MRKIIQIAVVQGDREYSTDNQIVALCDDGSIYLGTGCEIGGAGRHYMQWEKLPGLPNERKKFTRSALSERSKGLVL